MKKKGGYFLIYSIILFSVAFVLILFSSFTGVRYKDAQYEKNKLYQGAQESVLTLTEKNESLEKENAEKTKQIEALEKEKGDAGTKLSQNEIVIKNMDMLSEAQELYYNQNYGKAKEVLESIDTTALSENGRKHYNSLKNRIR